MAGTKKITKKKQMAKIMNQSVVRDYPVIVIENVAPCINDGEFAAKAVQGQPVTITADIFKDGHDIIKAALRYRPQGNQSWEQVPMRFNNNDQWEAVFVPEQNTRYRYTIAAWLDPVATWLDHVQKKAERYAHIKSEADEGIKLLKLMTKQAVGEDKKTITYFQKMITLSEGASDELLRLVSKDDFLRMIDQYPLKEQLVTYKHELPLVVDRPKAVFGAWYELFPRSQGTNSYHSGTFQDCIKRLPAIKEMGFDVLYLPPIHPIGLTNRKGRNNTLETDDRSPGSPWAIGNQAGGHKAVHPELGTLADFQQLVKEARAMDIEIALDFAIQCSPDHPYVKEHPEWFYHLPDGSIRYAENPPKRYQDIYPINFLTKDREALWQELKSIVVFWITKGVKIFRVDNPHTKPLRFWQWLITEIQASYPEVIFLAEAFTRPKIMKFLAKAGFTQSYTYFTWRNEKNDLRAYFEELTQSEMRHYFRGNLFANTPDILHAVLQHGGRPAFKMRAALAATLLPTWGIYSGFELCENQAKEPDSEEYLNSEKYEIKAWDWDRPGHIKTYISRLNHIRRQEPALQHYDNLRFFNSANQNILCYGKWTDDLKSIIIVCVNLDPYHTQEDLLHLPIWEFGLEDWQSFEMKDLISGERYIWKGQHHFIRLDPRVEPVHLFQLSK